MKYLSVILILGILMLACEPKLKPEKPSNLIPKDQMALVLYDMFLVNSAKGVDRITLEDKDINPEIYILLKHNIDSMQFAQSNDYYAHDIDVYNGIIENVKSKITSEKEKYEAISKKEEAQTKREKDSINQTTKIQPVGKKESVSRIKEVD